MSEEDVDDLMSELDALDAPPEPPAPELKLSEPAPAKAPDIRQLITPTKIAQTSTQIVEEPTMDLEFLRRLTQQYDVVGQEILTSWRADRAEAQDAIDLCNQEIQKAIANNRDPGRVYVETLVSAIEVKSNANATASSLIGMGIKLAGALKTKVSVTNNNVTNVGTINNELNTILSKDVPDV